MSVNSHLNGVASTLVLSPAETASIRTSIVTLESRLRSYFATQVPEQFQFGSSKRGTILPRKADESSDVDYMVRFNNDDNYKPQTFLDRLRRFTERHYQTSERKQSYPTIVLILNHIQFELVPAYRWGNRSTGALYIPSPQLGFQSWIQTDPAAADSAITWHNTRHRSLTKPLVRLLKYWNRRTRTQPYSSFEIEQYVTRCSFQTMTLAGCFYAAVEQLPEPWMIAADKRARIKRLKEVVRMAREYERRGDSASAEAEIQKVIPVFT